MTFLPFQTTLGPQHYMTANLYCVVSRPNTGLLPEKQDSSQSILSPSLPCWKRMHSYLLLVLGWGIVLLFYYSYDLELKQKRSKTRKLLTYLSITKRGRGRRRKISALTQFFVPLSRRKYKLKRPQGVT